MRVTTRQGGGFGIGEKKRETDLGEGWDVIASRGSLDRYGRCDAEEILKSS